MKAEDYQENYQSGWIKLNRSIKHHWLFQNDKFFKQWILMLLEVNHTDKDFLIGYDIHKIKRGQSAKSLRSWAELFNCNVKQVIKFFELLEKDKMISKKIIGKGKQSTTLINITNYTQYQGGFETQEGTKEGTQEKHKGNARGLQYKNVKNDKNEKKEIISSLQEPKHDIFNKWLKYRLEIKKPIKAESTIKNLIERFNKESLDKCKWVVNNSVENNYQGLFWDNYKETKSNNHARATVNFN